MRYYEVHAICNTNQYQFHYYQILDRYLIRDVRAWELVSLSHATIAVAPRQSQPALLACPRPGRGRTTGRAAKSVFAAFSRSALPHSFAMLAR